MKNFFALLLFAGGFLGWYLYNEKTDTSEGLAQSQLQLAELEQSVAERRSEFQRYQTISALQKQIGIKEAELAEIHLKIQNLAAQKSTNLKAQASQRGVIRQAQVGKTIQLTLNSGRVLGEVKIIKVEDSGLSVANATGIIKVTPNELPKEIKQMFFY